MRRFRTASMLVLALVCAAAAGSGTRAQDDAPAGHVYTNADLERFGSTTTTTSAAAPGADDAGWRFVTEFLEREQRRLQAERARDLEQRRLDREARGRDPRPTLGVGYPAWVVRGRIDGPRRAPTALRRPAAIVPLHAGPTLAERQRARAVRLSGRDAFPSAARRER